MPLLTTEKFQPQTPSAEEAVAIGLAFGKRLDNHALMQEILPVPKTRFSWRSRFATPKALIRIGGEEEVRFARTWLERDLRDPNDRVALMADEVLDGRAVSPQRPRLALDSEGTLFGEEFIGLTPAQDSGLMDSLRGTLIVVRAEALKFANQEVPAVDPVADRFLGRVLSSLSS